MELPTNGRITQYFDTPVDYIAGRTKHEALDIVTVGSQPITMLADCEVIKVIDKYSYLPNKGYGNELWVEYEGGIYRDRFCHLAKGSIVAVGTTLLKGATGAWTGQTGYRNPITTYHTHMERYKLINGQWVRVDPLTNPINEIDMDEVKQLINDLRTELMAYVDGKVSHRLSKAQAKKTYKLKKSKKRK